MTLAESTPKEPFSEPRVPRMLDVDGEPVTGDGNGGGPPAGATRAGLRGPGAGARLDRVQRVAALADAMRWPPEVAVARLDGELRLAVAPILAALVDDLARLKALMAGLVGEPRRPVRLDRPAAAGGVVAGDELDRFRPGRPVAFDAEADGGEPQRAPTNPFDALARRTLDLVLPEMEQALAELTVLVHEYAWDQDFRLVELVEALPGELLAALEARRPAWDDEGEERSGELARLAEHLARWRRETSGPGDPAADLRRAVVWAVARAGGGDGAAADGSGGPGGDVRDAAAGAITPLRRLLAALAREGDG